MLYYFQVFEAFRKRGFVQQFLLQVFLFILLRIIANFLLFKSCAMFKVQIII